MKGLGYVVLIILRLANLLNLMFKTIEKKKTEFINYKILKASELTPCNFI